MQLIAKIFISTLLAYIGALHLITPDLFNPVIPFPWKWEINLISGVLEIVLAILLWIPKTRDFAARMTALWFLILTPIHIYMIWEGIPFFSTNSPAILWARLFFQPVLFFLALVIQDKGWIMSQRWSDVIFLHYEVDKDDLQKLVPFPLDLFEGKAIVSIVPFVMGKIRFPFLPPIPGLSKLYELNLRTYVEVNGKKAVYFLTLDSNHLPAVLIARWFFSLPYRWRNLSFKHDDIYEFRAPDFEIKARVSETPIDNEFQRWATERYALFTKRGSWELCGIVEHAPWTLCDVKVESLTDRFSAPLGMDVSNKPIMAMAYAKTLNVRFRPFRKLKR